MFNFLVQFGKALQAEKQPTKAEVWLPSDTAPTTEWRSHTPAAKSEEVARWEDDGGRVL